MTNDNDVLPITQQELEAARDPLEALSIAISMLRNIERHNFYEMGDWHRRLIALEDALNKHNN